MLRHDDLPRTSGTYFPWLAASGSLRHAAGSVFAVPGNGGDFGGSGTRQSKTPTESGAGQGRVLVVEDEWFIAMETEAVLQAAGYTVVGIAGTADEAVALAERERPDIVLMDIRLRGQRDGIDAALEIRRRFGLACVFATAHTEPHLRERAAAAEPRGWLVKPFSDGQLLRAVSTALNDPA